MRRIIYCVLILVLFAGAPLTVIGETEAPLADKAYLIGAGDILFISIWKEVDLTQEVVVQPDGKIVFPLIGDIVVANKSPETVRGEITKKIRSFVPDPILTVSVKEIKSLKIFVVGKVNEPGQFELTANVNVLQALAMAGGLNSYANGDKIKVFRESTTGTQIYRFDYDDVSVGKNLNQNIILKRGDVIVVP